MGQKGTNAIFVMTHAEILLIPEDQTIMNARVVVDFRPQKIDPHHIRITAGGNLINYPGKLTTNSRPHHIKTDVEQCPQHQRSKVHVPGHQELLLDGPPRSI